MSDKSLTKDDPLSTEALNQLNRLHSLYLQLASKLADLELEKIRVLAQIRTVAEEKDRFFERELVDRGLSPTTVVKIDEETGEITIVSPSGGTPPPPAS